MVFDIFILFLILGRFYLVGIRNKSGDSLYKPLTLSEIRAKEKHLSRERDLCLIKKGIKTADQINMENSISYGLTKEFKIIKKDGKKNNNI